MSDESRQSEAAGQQAEAMPTASTRDLGTVSQHEG